MDIEAGNHVSITGTRGTFLVLRTPDETKDGSVLLFGGDTNPNGKQGYRSVMPDKIKVKPVKRQGKQKLAEA